MYSIPRPRRSGWQLLGFEQPSGHLGLDLGAALKTIFSVLIVAVLVYLVCSGGTRDMEKWDFGNGAGILPRSAFLIVYVAEEYNAFDVLRGGEQ